MATVSCYVPTDMYATASMPAGTATITSATATAITMQIGADSITMYGQYTYNASQQLTGGTFTGMDASYNGVLQVSIRGLSIDVYSLVYDPAASTDAAIFSGNDTFNGSSGADMLRAYNGNDTLYGNGGNDRLAGEAGNDILSGGTGNDTLNGGTGADRMVGGSGNDIYYVDNLSDAVVETSTLPSEIDRVVSSISYTLGAYVENLTLNGTAAINGNGNALNNTIVGNAAANILNGGAGNDVLNGGAGTDRMVGGSGNDIYYVDNVRDVVVEAAASGTDRVISSVSYTLGANVENLTLTGNDIINATGKAINGTGNGLNNVIIGNMGANILSGGGGNDILDGGSRIEQMYGGSAIDRLYGGSGNDTYYVDSNDIVVETSSLPSEIDHVISIGSFTLGSNIENLTLVRNTYSTSTFVGTGNALDNIITGSDGDDSLSGIGGNDTLYGGDGNDTLYGGDGNDILYGGTAGNTLNGSFDGSDTLYGNAGNDILVGGSGPNNLYGGDGNDILNNSAGYGLLDGGTGADRMTGGDSGDTYFVDDIGDVVIETSSTWNNHVIDHIYSSIDYTLDANIENLTLTGTTATQGTGNALNNTIVGNALSNILDGGDGLDTLKGGDGDDTLNGGNGIDILDGGAGNDTLNGGAGNDKLTGGAGNDTLIGGAGTDTLAGGAGDDTYYIDDAGPTTVFNVTGQPGNYVSGGTNTTYTSATGTWFTYVSDRTGDGIVDGIDIAYSDTVFGQVFLTIGANQPAYRYSGIATDNLSPGTYLNANNFSFGNAPYLDFSLDYRGGNTHCQSFTIHSLDIDYSGATPALRSFSVSFTLSNVVNGPTMTGELNYNIPVSTLGEQVTELANEGTDHVISSVSYALSANVENLSLSGAAAINGTGNGFDNTIIGNDADNILTGGLGMDTLTGSLGADTFDYNAIAESAAGANCDTITDFLCGTDKIDLSTIDAILGGGTADDAFTFIDTAPFSAAGQVRFENGILYANVDADLAADFQINLTGVVTFAAADALL